MLDFINAACARIADVQDHRSAAGGRHPGRHDSGADRGTRQSRLHLQKSELRSRSTASKSIAWRTKPTRSARDAIGRLFEQETDPITLIKMKELLEFLEDATDKAEDVADVLETVVLKSA